MLSSRVAILLMSAYLVAGQRPSFAGFRPIGFPELANKTTPETDDLGNRFGDDGQPLPLPIEAKGDRDLVDRISKLPVDKQPFWYINWKALEEHRKNPQTYEQRPNVFVDPNTSNIANQTNELVSKFGEFNKQVEKPQQIPTAQNFNQFGQIPNAQNFNQFGQIPTVQNTNQFGQNPTAQNTNRFGQIPSAQNTNQFGQAQAAQNFNQFGQIPTAQNANQFAQNNQFGPRRSDKRYYPYV